ncbi:MAG: hypothetical protein ACJA13_003731 [Paraglaciecola sp.]|jgi:hypothetical protein
MLDFQKTQLAFIDHLKNPEVNKFDLGIEDRRLKIYRELFFNNIKGFLNSGFPVLQSLYSDTAWDLMARQFFAQHRCRSPYFIDISKEFVEYLSNTYPLTDNDPPFLLELAHYEWMELAISVRKQTQELTPWDGNSVVEAIQLSELASVVSYQFPVHQISQVFQPTQAGEAVYLVIHRDDQYEVGFTLINALTAHLLQTIQTQKSIKLEHLITLMIEGLPQLEEQQIAEGVKQIVVQMLQQRILFPA